MEQDYGPVGDARYSSQQILGIRFFDGDVEQAVDVMWQRGGFMVAPSGTCFHRLRHDAPYREAMINADLAIPDSGAMVLLWKLLRGKALTRISGLRYLRCLATRSVANKTRTRLWVVPNDKARDKTASWLRANQLPFTDGDLYVAPQYASIVEDRQLVAKIDSQKPNDVIIGIGSGPQEKLGHYLRDNLGYRPAIHCIGAALGFLTGDQVAIPDWADRLYLGWTLRLVSQPRVFVPRLTRALELPWLIWRYGERMPPLKRRENDV